MPRYSYKAKNLKGQEESGSMEAADYSQLAKVIRQKGYFLLSAEEESKKGKKGKFGLGNLSFFEKFFGVPLSEKIFFTRNLEVMIKTGVSLPRAFEILSEQAKNKKFKGALKKISEKIIKGETLSGATGSFPEIFSNLYQETLKVGEETGKIEESLDVLSLQMEREHDLKSQIKSAMVYPVMVLVLAVIIGIAMFIFAIPKLQEAFRELKVPLPFTTKILLSFSNFLVSHLFVLFLISAALIFGSVFAFKKGKGGRIFGKTALSVPLISKIIRQINSALALRTLSSLLSAGVPIVRSLEVAAGSLGNFYFRKSLKKAAEVVEKGKKLSEALEPCKDLYSPMVVEMMRVGEETGETSAILEKLADFYEKEVAAATQKISSVIEPFLIILIGGIVGFFAISMMQPMFSLMKGF